MRSRLRATAPFPFPLSIPEPFAGGVGVDGDWEEVEEVVGAAAEGLVDFLDFFFFSCDALRMEEGGSNGRNNGWKIGKERRERKK